MRLEARASLSRVALVVAPFAAIAFTLGVTMLLVAWAGAPIGETYGLMFAGGFGSRFAWSETLTRATPLILTGLSAAIAFRARLWNIGAEGQLYAGALAAVAVGGLHGGAGFELPASVLFPLMLGAAVLAGAALLLIPTLLRTRFGVDEVVTTLLLNFIVLLFVSMMLDGPMKDPTALGWPQSVALRDDLQLDKLIPRTRVHTGLIFAIVLAALLAFMMRVTDPRLRDARRRGECTRCGVRRRACRPHDGHRCADLRWPGRVRRRNRGRRADRLRHARHVARLRISAGSSSRCSRD